MSDYREKWIFTDPVWSFYFAQHVFCCDSSCLCNIRTLAKLTFGLETPSFLGEMQGGYIEIHLVNLEYHRKGVINSNN